ncbi:Rieske (2Fe-2S) protein [Microlunatus flavus]|uniref:Cytochrome bc1 complex Rieske iron-sulfur subunit n=1 Tax=Microlunatus flavus TaxID=1036181 RepID=A0A1H9B4W5_9ACTN|nr:Rieske (2Fe-2S) protein [Microlunatus flavus]SEP83879.1 Ferredoxin subunit of nitrite reductase or a ring-hydroxylating dioxygenase [Microlunatus flavus]
MTPYVRPERRISRRTLLGSAGLAAAAVGGLSACGGGGDGGAGSSSGGSAGPVSAKTSDITVGGGKVFAEGQAVITQPAAGEFKAFSSICTHAGCPVADVTSTINCNCHGSKFSITDGSVVNGPATQPLPARTVSVSGDTVSVS